MLYHIPANFSFLDSLASYVLEKYNKESENALAEIYIFLPSRRAVHNLKEKLLLHSHKKAIILPRICPIGDIGTEEFSIYSLGLSKNRDLPRALTKIEQKILFTKLILDKVSTGHLQLTPSMLSDIGYSRLATELIDLLSDLEKTQIHPTVLNNLIKDEGNDFALHWQYISQFLQLIVEWPILLKEKNLTDPIEFRNLIITDLIDYWQTNPPNFPVIAAGSTGSTKATLKLLKAIDSLTHGHVIIPSLDTDLKEETWRNIDELHPQYNLKNLIEYLGYKRMEINLWPGCVEKYRYTTNERMKFISEIMHPHNAINNWHNLSEQIYDKKIIENMKYVVCDNLYQEANIIAIIMRQALETKGKTVALVTNDNSLTQNVMANLARWDIAVHSSSGKKLIDTASAIYLRLTLDAINTNFQLIPLLTLLKHPFTLLNHDKKLLNQLIMRLELRVLRKMRIKPGLDGLLDTLQIVGDQELYELVKQLKSYTSSFINLYNNKKVSFTKLLSEHILLIEKLTKRNDFIENDYARDNYNIWGEEEGIELAEFLLELREYMPELEDIETSAYAEILYGFLREQLYFPVSKYNNRLTILTPIEARFHATDLLVLGGLNEGCWPELPAKSPFLNKNMRERVGLPGIEQKIGQAAHDFFTLCGAKEIIFTRSRKLQSNQTIASRFLLRLEAVLSKLNLLNLFKDNPYLDWFKLLNSVTEPNNILPPCPKPPKEYRPQKLSATQVELLMQDPYSIYAKYILKLKPLDEINASTAADFGNFVHKSLEYFSTLKITNENEEYIYQQLLKCGQTIIQDYITHQAIYYLWWPRFERIAKWIAVQENKNMTNHNKLIFSEIMGQMVITLNNNDLFILTAKADRIEIIKKEVKNEPKSEERSIQKEYMSGKPYNTQSNFLGRKVVQEISIIDYKTGRVPEVNKVKNGFNPQLPLEGLIAQSKGFSCQTTNSDYLITGLIYIDLSGSERVGNMVSFTNCVDDLIKQTEIKIRSLLNFFNDPNTPYLSCPLPSHSPRYNQYIHLARSKEWK